MNNFNGIGRATKDPEVRYSSGDKPTAIARLAIAIDRRFKRDGEPTADFINCIAFGNTAETIEKYVRKGTKIGVTGRIQTGSYTNKEGNKVYTTDVVIEQITFCESKGASAGGSDSSANSNAGEGSADEFISLPEGIDEELPFN